MVDGPPKMSPRWMAKSGVYTQNLVNEFYKKGCQEKSSASTGGEICFSRSSPLKLRFSGEAWPIAHAHKFPPRMVAMPSSSKERQAKLVLKVNHGSIRGSWPMAISGYPRGHSV